MNMIDLNKAFFSDLYKEAFEADNMRFHACIETTDTDKDFIKKTTSIKHYQSLDLKIAIIKHSDDNRFLAILGRQQFNNLPPEIKIQRIEENADAFTVLGGSGLLKPKNPSALRDANWSTIRADKKGTQENLTRISLDQIKDIIEDFSFYKIDYLPFDPVDGGEDRFLLLLLLALNIGDQEKLQNRPQLIEIIVGLDEFPFHLLHSAYVAQTWRHSYIDIYRCIEILYPIPKMIELRELISMRTSGWLQSEISAIKLFQDVNKATGWREIEIHGLERLIRDCTSSNITKVFDLLESKNLIDSSETEIIKELSKTELMSIGSFKALFETIRDALSNLPEADIQKVKQYKEQKSATLIANALYTTRNEIVHYRTPNRSPSEEKIKVAFHALTLILNDIYKKHQAETFA